MRPPFRALVICCLVAVVGGYFLGERQRQQRRYDAWMRDQIAHASLAVPVRIILPDPEHATLGEALKVLRQQVDVPIDFDSALASLTIGPGRLVLQDGTQKGIYQGPLDDVLQQILSSISSSDEPYFRFAEGRIVIRFWPDYPPAALTKNYETPSNGPGQVQLDERDIVHVITTSIDPDCWDDVGGPYTAMDSPGGVTVAASSQIHRKIALMLRQLADLPAEPESLRPVPFLEAGYPYDPSGGPSSLVAALNRTGDFEYAEVPLKEFLESISDRFQFPIVIATRKLEEAAVNLDVPITFTMSNVSLRTFLRHALGELGLTYSLGPEGMEITTPEDAGSRLISLLYPVYDLVDLSSPQESQRLLEVITAAVDPDTWEDVGGPGSVQVIAGGWLLVWQMQEGHEHVLEFLNQLRHDIPIASRSRPELTGREQATRRTQALLCGAEILDLGPLPLDQFAAALGKRLGIGVALARRWLEEAAVDPHSTIICMDSQPQPLWRQLDEALQMYGLSFLIEHDSIVITSQEHAESRLDREIVDLRELTVLGSDVASEQLLIHLILHSVDLNTWDDFGGPGAIDSFKGCLIIHQNRPSLFEIREFLSWLRAHRSELPTQTEIALLDKNGQEYRRLVALSNSSPDRWLAVYLRFVLNPEISVMEPVKRQVQTMSFGCGGFSGGGVF